MSPTNARWCPRRSTARCDSIERGISAHSSRSRSTQIFPRSRATQLGALASSTAEAIGSMRGSSRRVRQHDFTFRGWGGARPGAGRKPTGARPGVRHREREVLSARHPLHVTVRLRAGLPSLRREATRHAIERAFSSGAERFGFRLTQYSIQSNHLHLVAEAGDRRALSRGMQGLLVRVARAVNRLWRRMGSVFADRYHARQLRTPREVRTALVYVLHNARHHGVGVSGVDAYSSGPWFDGWKHARTRLRAFPVALARTWLLRIGWRRHGLIGLDECPRERCR